MSENVSAKRSAIPRAAALATTAMALWAAHSGCSGPTDPPPPPGGGSQLALSFELFQSSVEPILVTHGCDAEGDCHGGGIRGTLELSPPGAKDVQFDFDQVKRQVSPTAFTSSPILTEPLAIAAGGTPHQIHPFDSTSDPEYLAILAWIEDGAQP